jgi:alkanesulfonate monooxygenase SsuD/methylene tetrahydromethanopterin reductase-like flavin-dependent oxidoreductase (luciferase family)
MGYVETTLRDGLTLRQLLKRLAGARGHLAIAGTPEQVADTIEDWFRTGAADGFNVMPPVITQQLELFASEVVPILRKRGLFAATTRAARCAVISACPICRPCSTRRRRMPQ